MKTALCVLLYCVLCAAGEEYRLQSLKDSQGDITTNLTIGSSITLTCGLLNNTRLVLYGPGGRAVVTVSDGCSQRIHDDKRKPRIETAFCRNNEYRITINQIQLEDEGEWSCLSYNPGVRSQKIFVEVISNTETTATTSTTSSTVTAAEHTSEQEPKPSVWVRQEGTTPNNKLTVGRGDVIARDRLILGLGAALGVSLFLLILAGVGLAIRQARKCSKHEAAEADSEQKKIGEQEDCQEPAYVNNYMEDVASGRVSSVRGHYSDLQCERQDNSHTYEVIDREAQGQVMSPDTVYYNCQGGTQDIAQI